MAVDPQKTTTEERTALHSQITNPVVELPKRWFLRLWTRKGGGFYGLGFVITFVVLEIQAITGDVIESESLSAFIMGEAFGFLLRFSVQSFINGLRAVIWPVYVLDVFGAWWGFAILAGGWFVFKYALRPLVEDWLPELREVREQKELQKREKKNRRARTASNEK